MSDIIITDDQKVGIKKLYSKSALFHIGSTKKKPDITASLHDAIKQLTPTAYWLYSFLLFQDKKTFQPSINYLAYTTGLTTELVRTFLNELVYKGYLVLRQTRGEIHYIVYYQNLDSIIFQGKKGLKNKGVKPQTLKKRDDLPYKKAQEKANAILQKKYEQVKKDKGEK